MKHEFYRQIAKKYSNIRFHKVCPVGVELLHVEGRADRQTDGHEEANSRFSKFRESA